MQISNALDLPPVPKRVPVTGLTMVACIALLAAVGLGIVSAAAYMLHPAPTQTGSPGRPDDQAIASLNVDDRGQILAEGAAAQRRNAAILPSRQPLQKAAILDLSTAAKTTYDNALQCLTQAIYYEAANEPLEGRRAVAQVVLNRVRHPGYPKSVCGVVYQGHERYTGCQFSFTCDGSLMRVPMPRQWSQAREIAKEALAGHIARSVGTATHYHADYVLPKWAFRLGKIEQIGRHIFYRFNGSWGNAAAFAGRYNAVEVIPRVDFSALRTRLNPPEPGEDSDLVPGLSVAPHVADRHAQNDVGGRLDVTKGWRLTIPDPISAHLSPADVVATEPEPGIGQGTRDSVALASFPSATVTQ